MKKLCEEFKKFVSRGNVLDMAVGVIMGTAFTAIINALVGGVFMPIVGYLIDGVNFTELRVVLKPAVGETPEVAILYGSFLQQTINFFIVALVVFMLVKALNRLQKKKEEAPPEPAADVALLTEIRDLLKKTD